MEIKICLPYVGEFGGELLKVVPQVNANADSLIVCHEKYKECLYSEADERYIFDRLEFGNENPMAIITALHEKIGDHFGSEYKYITWKRLPPKRNQFFVPETADFPFTTDVVLFPRKKPNMAAKNWKGWLDLLDAFKAEGLKVFAAGHADSSYHLDCPAAWDYDDNLGATIWAIKNSKVRLGPITALHVLSVMCGKEPWVLTTREGYSHLKSRTGVNIGYLQHVDHKKVGWRIVPYLENIRRIVNEVVNSCVGK